MAGVAANRGARPGWWRDAGGAERAGQGAGGDRREAAAGRAGSHPPLAGRAPGPPGGAGDAAARGLAADGAGPQRELLAAGAQRPVLGAPFDPAAAPAADAGLQVGRIGDEAVGAQRPALVIVGDGLAAGSAACALLEARVRDTGPADPPAIQRLFDAHDPVTAGAGRADDPGDALRHAALRPAAGSPATAPDGPPRSATRGGPPMPRPVSAGMRAGEPCGGRRRRRHPGWHEGPAR